MRQYLPIRRVLLSMILATATVHRAASFGGSKNCAAVQMRSNENISALRLFSRLTSLDAINPETLTVDSSRHKEKSRRSFLSILLSATICSSANTAARAEDEGGQGAYENPNIPPGPEERSGLVVLRVAEVCQFQEKILRAVANGDVDAEVSPMQIVFGTQIMLRNSNLDGNMKLMIYNEVPRKKREEAIRNAVRTMNTLQDISSTAAKIQRPFEKEEMLEIADLYKLCRIQLNDMYEYLPQKEKEKYYGYFMKVTEYEKKIAEGTYNPDLDGILQLED